MGDMLLWILAGTGLLFVLGWCAIQCAEASQGAMQDVADRFGGRVSRASGNDTRGAELTVSGIPVDLVVAPGGWRRPARMEVTFHARLPGNFLVLPESLLQSEHRLFGTFHPPLSDPEFDARFVVRGQPRDWVADVLDPDTRARLVSVTALVERSAEDGRVSWEAGPRGMTLTCHGALFEDANRLVCLVLLAETLFLRLQAVAPLFAELPDRRIDPTAGTCPVCAGALTGFVRRCGKCRTPHHDECWSYMGACGMYACACTRSELQLLEGREDVDLPAETACEEPDPGLSVLAQEEAPPAAAG